LKKILALGSEKKNPQINHYNLQLAYIVKFLLSIL